MDGSITVALIVGIANKGKWKQGAIWADLSPESKKDQTYICGRTDNAVIGCAGFLHLCERQLRPPWKMRTE